MSADLFVPTETLVLEPFVRAGVLGATEVQAACTFARATGETGADVLLAAALAVRAPLHGSVCIDLSTIEHQVVSTLEATADVLTDDAAPDGVNPDDVAPDTGGPAGDGGVDLNDLPWPDPTTWLATVAASPLVQVAAAHEASTPARRPPLVLDRGLLYLARYWALERYVAADVLTRGRPAADRADRAGAAPATTPVPAAGASAEVLRLFQAAAQATGTPIDPDQLAAAQAAATQDFVVIAGGPGTGKTTTVARLLAGLVSAHDQAGAHPRIALVAPTGKASARMTEAIRHALPDLQGHLGPDVVDHIRALEAVTIHRLLGRAYGSGFRHGPHHPLPHDIVIVDEVSMVSLSLMAHLLAAIRPTAKVVLVGDPYQLASVEAGAVLGDIVGIGSSATHGGEPVPPVAITDSVRPLHRTHRQGADSGILRLATAIREGQGDEVMTLLRANGPDVVWVDPDHPTLWASVAAVRDELTDAATAAVEAARAGDISEALERIGRLKVLSALRRGGNGVEGWNDLVEQRLRDAGVIGWNSWYSGRPVMVTANDYLNGVFNGDLGVAIRNGDRYQVWFPRAGRNQMVEAVRLDRYVTQWAMSIHKSQGSEFPHVVVTLPPPPARILTRELLYTAVTRAKERLTLVATEAAVRAAVDRPVARASGLAARLGP